ncbi:MAG: GIY-YIG nuclease family protein [Spirochaetales bacterium]|nr:GIY-YIG nuclease family protein [Spirochaetales bacterium]
MSVKPGFVYFLTNYNNRVLYIGVTSDLQKRLFEHKTKAIQGFTAKYNLTKLVYFEQCENIKDAIFREKQLKRWLRKKKNELVNSVNPEWKDLSLDWES